VYEEITRPPRRAEDADQIVRLFQAWAKALPDPQVSVKSAIAEGDNVAVELRVIGAMHGPFGDFSPRRKPQVMCGAVFCSYEGGLIKELRNYFDSLALFQVLGIRP
jgi:predicted ester cyclase